MRTDNIKQTHDKPNMLRAGRDKQEQNMHLLTKAEIKINVNHASQVCTENESLFDHQLSER